MRQIQIYQLIYINSAYGPRIDIMKRIHKANAMASTGLAKTDLVCSIMVRLDLYQA